MGRCCNAGFLFPWPWVWCSSRLRLLQQIPQQCLQVRSIDKFHIFFKYLPIFRDALLTSFINSATSFVAGFVIFSVLGYMAHASNQSIQDVATEGPGLVFVVYPAAIATMPGSTFWALIFFMMLLTLGLDSSVSSIFDSSNK